MTPADRTTLVKRIASDIGFDRVGITRAEPLPRADYVGAWLDAGHAGQMHYLERPERTDPRRLLDNARSIIALAANYHQPLPPVDAGAEPVGRVAMYAWGEDYHDVLKQKLRHLIDRMREAVNTPFEARPCVDTAPVIERELAAAAGLGWIGKNTLVLHQDLGSYFFLAEVVTTLDLVPDVPAVDHCGSCRRCLDACPTDAFPKPYTMDASRCISYLTIEHREAIPMPLRPRMGDWVFGCDVCQEVCPYNRDAPETTEPRFTAIPERPRPSLRRLLDPDDDHTQAVRRRGAARRAKPNMLRRNAAVALGNQHHADAADVLRKTATAAEPLAAEHAAWALDQLTV
jgi:epoxyqueuosine reductase